MWWSKYDCCLFRSLGDAIVGAFPVAVVLAVIGLLFWLH